MTGPNSPPGDPVGSQAAPPGAGGAVLYLDYDGALHHEAVYWDPHWKRPFIQAPVEYTMFQHAALLDEMLAPHPGIGIVLSTSWVRHYGLRKAAKELPARLRARVIGSTRDAQVPGDLFEYLSRGEQVCTDVLRRRPGSWLALDDDPLGWPKWADRNVLLTDPYEGISPPHLQEELRRRLVLLSAMQLPVPTEAR
jgi:hypothetical protein